MSELVNKKFNPQKAIKRGFLKQNSVFTKQYSISDGEFVLKVKIKPPNIIKTELKETETDEIYTLHLTSAEGNFVGKIREEYQKILDEISSACFEPNYFKNETTYKVIDYIKAKYGDEVEYLWEKTPNNAVARCKDNKKWYIALLTVRKDRLGFETTENVEVANLMASADIIPELIKEDNIFPAYHMNKKHWFTVILDGSFDFGRLCEMIDKSYMLAKKGGSKGVNKRISR